VLRIGHWLGCKIGLQVGESHDHLYGVVDRRQARAFGLQSRCSVDRDQLCPWPRLCPATELCSMSTDR